MPYVLRKKPRFELGSPLVKIDENPLSVFNLEGAILPWVEFIGPLLANGFPLTQNSRFLGITT